MSTSASSSTSSGGGGCDPSTCTGTQCAGDLCCFWSCGNGECNQTCNF
jgi:hypothetical protein